MRLFIYSTLFALLAAFYSACQPSHMSISGSVTNYKYESVSLFRVSEGALELVDVALLNEDSLFVFNLPEGKTGLYYLGGDDTERQVYDNLYLRAGDTAELLIDGQRIVDSTLPYPDLVKIQNDWDSMFNEYRGQMFLYSRNVDSIGHVVNRFEAATKAFQESVNTKDAVFNELMTITSQLDFEKLCIGICMMAGEDIVEKLFQQHAYKELLSNEFGSAGALKIRIGEVYIATALLFKTQMAKINQLDYVEFCMLALKNDSLKGHFLNRHIHKRHVSGQAYIDLMDQHGKYIITEKQKSDIAAYEKEIMKYALGQPAFDFKYEDINGDLHALSDYKGKVVLVDVWATWCAPCKAEIPHLEKLEEHYHGNDEVVFMSVSIDKPGDRNKWEQFIEDKKLKGVQLLADKAFKSQILLDYDITGVPRFMLFDKEGKIVSVNSPRPSNPALKTLIDEHL